VAFCHVSNQRRLIQSLPILLTSHALFVVSSTQGYASNYSVAKLVNTTSAILNAEAAELIRLITQEVLSTITMMMEMP